MRLDEGRAEVQLDTTESDTDQRLARANEMVIIILNEYQSAMHSGLHGHSQNQPFHEAVKDPSLAEDVAGAL